MTADNEAVNPLLPVVMVLLAELERVKAEQLTNEDREIALQMRQGALIIAAACARWGGLEGKREKRGA